MKKLITFDDVLISPKFSEITSRKNVSISTTLGIDPQFKLQLPVISSNMDTVTGPEMAIAMGRQGGLGILHRFWTIEENVAAVKKVIAAEVEVGASFGLGEYELKRAKALFEAGCEFLVLDVAHGAQRAVVTQYDAVKKILGRNAVVVVGNFGNAESVNMFVKELGYKPDVIKTGIGPGASCLTQRKTGVGTPQLSAIIDCVSTGIPVIADGGMKTSGDIAKALGAGAKAVMLGSMLSGTNETPGDFIFPNGDRYKSVQEGTKVYKQYRGSASKESYKDQGKDWACAEGEAFLVLAKGPVKEVLADIEGGIRSSFSYVGASTLQQFQDLVEFVEISNNAVKESGAHGKTTI